MSVVTTHKEQQQAKAADSMFSRVVARYSLLDQKVQDTIRAFQEHVPKPTLDDLSQLDQVLAAHAQRKAKKAQAARRALVSSVSCLVACRHVRRRNVCCSLQVDAMQEKTLSAAGRGPQGWPSESPVHATPEQLGASRSRSQGGMDAVDSRQGKGRSRNGSGIARGLSSAASDSSTLYLDVRKDEWYAVGVDQAAKAAEREANEKKQKNRERAFVYQTLQVQQEQLKEVWERELEEERQQARQDKALQKLWKDKEKQRLADLAVWQRKEKLRAEKAKKDFMDDYRAGVLAEQVEENEQVRKIKALIVEDEMKARAKMAKVQADMEEVKAFNAAELQRKSKAQRLQLAKDQHDLEIYQVATRA
jgi:hypothetical protein